MVLRCYTVVDGEPALEKASVHLLHQPLVNMRGGQACDFMDEELIAKACATVDQKEGDETLSKLCDDR